MFHRSLGFVALGLVLTALSVDAGGGKDTKKKTTAVASGTGTIEIYKGKEGYRYRIKGADGKTVAMPLPQMSWESKADVMKALDELKATLNKATPVEVKADAK